MPAAASVAPASVVIQYATNASGLASVALGPAPAGSVLLSFVAHARRQIVVRLQTGPVRAARASRS